MATPVPQPVEVQTPSATLTPSLVRTLLPFIAGLIGTWLLEKFGVEVDTATIGALLTAGIGYGYYVVVRFLEVYGSDKWGYILGFRKLPVYASPPLPATVVADDNGSVELGTVGGVLVLAGVLGLVFTMATAARDGVIVSIIVLAVGIALVLLGGRRGGHRL